jgi:hypothetical protein
MSERPRPKREGEAWSQRPADYQRDPLAAPLPDAAQGHETILVADDDREVRRAVVNILRRSGFQVLEAGSGNEAVRTAEQEAGPIHLVLADVVMPGMSTDELRDRVAQIRPGTRILFMSGYIHDGDVREQVLHGPVPFIEKPFTAADLVGAIRAELAGPGH